MAEINPPLYLDQDDAYGAADLGLPFRDILGEGVVGAGDLGVTAGTGLKSSVAKGAAWVKGDDDTDKQPTYRIFNDAAVLLQHDAADATNARIDLVTAQVLDSAFSGVSKLWQLAIVKGTPATTPVAPATPANALALAQVTIPAGSGTLGTIADQRVRAIVGGGAVAKRHAQGIRAANLSIPIATTTNVTLPVENVDTDNMFTPGSHMITARRAGWYRVEGWVSYASGDGGHRLLTLNSTVTGEHDRDFRLADSGLGPRPRVSQVILLSEGESVYMTTWHDGGAAQIITNALLSVEYVGPE